MRQISIWRSTNCRTALWFATGAIIFTLLTGCGSGGDSGITASLLAADDTQATRSAEQVDAVTTAALEPISYMTEGEIGRAETVYPKVSVTRTDTATTVTVDFGTTPLTTYGGREISGVFTLTSSRANNTGSIAFTNVTINGRAVNGSASLSNLSITKDAISATVAFDLTVGSVGKSVGSLQVNAVRATHLLTVTSGSLTATPEGSARTYSVVTANLVRDPVDNGNFLPEAGTHTITYPTTIRGTTTTVRAVVTYLTTTPVDRIVTVSINGATPIHYTLPQFK